MTIKRNNYGVLQKMNFKITYLCHQVKQHTATFLQFATLWGIQLDLT